MSDTQKAKIDPIGDVLFGVTLAYTALALELIESGAIKADGLVERMDEVRQVARNAGAVRGDKWITEIRDFIASGREADASKQ